jgi:hypothetical protein
MRIDSAEKEWTKPTDEKIGGHKLYTSERNDDIPPNT